MSTGTVGGGYGALMLKGKAKKTKQASPTASPSTEAKRAPQSGQPAAAKAAKVLSLKENNAVQGKKDYKPPAPEEPKQQAPKKEAEPAAKKTTAEEKKEREKTDRHVARSGKSPGRGAKGEDDPSAIAADEAVAAADDPAAASQDRAAVKEAERKRKEDEEEKKKREEEERQITYDDYLKQQKEKAAELPKLGEARKVDTKAFAQFGELKKGDKGEADPFGFSKKKEAPKAAAAAPAKPAGKAAAPAAGKGKPAPKAAAKEEAATTSKKPKYQDMTAELLKVTVNSEQPKPKGKGKGGGGGGKGGAPPRGPPEWNLESKVDPADGVTRTKREFVQKYGGFTEWDAACKAAAAATAAATSSPAGSPGRGAAPEDATW